MPKTYRADQNGPHRVAFDRARKKILLTQDTCGICGRPVDKALKFPDPMSPTVDHIIPIARGGHPSAIENLQLAHLCCNQRKNDKVQGTQESALVKEPVPVRMLPQSRDWLSYRSA